MVACPCGGYRDGVPGPSDEDHNQHVEGLQRPLTLLNLPVDILREIIKEVTHTNDLAALALTHSALYRLAIPHIYSRFDIVWPDSTNSSDAKSGVDALTFGLSTLVLSKDALDGHNKIARFCTQCERELDWLTEVGETRSGFRRRGNDYAKFTKKFSLGNGPSEWVSEYFINKESGKMLGTLAALALARMVNLESFVWDMASGIVKDVWDSLSIRDNARRPSKLQSIWVRCHDNKNTGYTYVSSTYPAYLSTSTSAGAGQSSKDNIPMIDSYRRIEHPSFSRLPALKSITVLAIDELAYLEELSVLVERSIRTLRELRIGTSSKWPPAKPPEVQASTVHAFMGNDGVMGVLFSKILKVRDSHAHVDHAIRPAPQSRQPLDIHQDGDVHIAALKETKASEQVSIQEIQNESQAESDSLPAASQSGEVEAVLDEIVDDTVSSIEPQSHAELPIVHNKDSNVTQSLKTSETPGRKLHLETLEIEKTPLAIKVLREAIDWTRLASLTLLNCEGDEKLWKALKKSFAPQPSLLFRRSSKDSMEPLEYQLKLKKIRTNSVSPTLISFLKDTLAPNSLECLFLHDKEDESSKVSIDSILRGPLRWHRASLKKLMIDSAAGSRRQSKAKKWAFSRDVLAFVTSGKMSRIRELSFTVEYKDWHFFLQRLPRIPHLRSLHVPQVIDHIHGSGMETRELASQILDIVTLRPEIELCYMGLGNKCFEIFEANSKDGKSNNDSSHLNGESDTEDEDDDDAVDDGNEDDEDDEYVNDQTGGEGDQETDGDGDNLSDTSLFDAEDSGKPRLDFREILFYVEKVDIFKARNCTL